MKPNDRNHNMLIYDISRPLNNFIETYPGDPEFRLSYLQTIEEGSPFSLSSFSMSSHTGTHIDAPSHFLSGGLTIDELPLSLLMGTAVLIQTTQEYIDAQTLEESNIPKNTSRLLIGTKNPRFKGMTIAGAKWIMGKTINLVGIDRLSIEEPDTETFPIHKYLLSNHILLIEGLKLDAVPADTYDLICLPLPISSAEAAPVRAVLTKNVVKNGK
ncbi:MAG: cyclase [Dehalococcoidia bacterium]|nr:cyclase [Dehalococcoidia bacterium]